MDYWCFFYIDKDSSIRFGIINWCLWFFIGWRSFWLWDRVYLSLNIVGLYVVVVESFYKIVVILYYDEGISVNSLNKW